MSVAQADARRRKPWQVLWSTAIFLLTAWTKAKPMFLISRKCLKLLIGVVWLVCMLWELLSLNIFLVWDGPLPFVLYLQLDNTVRENKNSIVFAYLSMLVERKVFKKIKVNFLMVGHTHDHVDQMFSRFSTSLRSRNAFTVKQLGDVLRQSYTPQPLITMLEETYDFKRFILEQPLPVGSLVDITYNQQFKIEMTTDHVLPRIWTKRLSTYAQWTPEEGVKHLLFFPLGRDMHPTKLVALKFQVKARKARGAGGLSMMVPNALQNVDTIRKDIQVVCFSYFNDEEKDWWNHWFYKQEALARRMESGREIPLEQHWHWPRAQEEETPRIEVNVNEVITMVVVELRVFGERRPLYARSRKARLGTEAYDRAHNIGDIKELGENQMMAVLAEDENSFWVCQVLKIINHDIEMQPCMVHIQWFTTLDNDPYVGQYFIEKRKENGSGRRSILYKQDIDLSKIHVLAFDFTLTTNHKLRKITTTQIKKELFRLEQEIAVENGVNVNSQPIDLQDSLDNVGVEANPDIDKICSPYKISSPYL